MKTLTVEFMTPEGAVEKSFKRTFDRKSAVESMRDFGKTTADIAGGGEGKPSNGIVATANNKFRFNAWKDIDNELWNTIKYKGKFFMKVTE